MARNPSMRASDAERDRVAAALQEHCAQGRLTVEEFHERLDRAYTARTVGELDDVTADLPAQDPHQLPVPAERQSEQLRRRDDALVDLPGGLWPWVWGTLAVLGMLGVAVVVLVFLLL